MNKKEALGIINESYKLYEEFLTKKEFYFIYGENKKLEYLKILFEDTNFLHLTGVETRLSPKEFVKMLKRGKINEGHFQLKKDGTTKLKLDVLKKLHLIVSVPTTIGVYNGFMKLNLHSDYIIGDNRKVLALGLKEIKEYLCVPKSLLNQSTQKVEEIIGKPNRVIMVFFKPTKFSENIEISYKSKKITEEEVRKIEILKKEIEIK